MVDGYYTFWVVKDFRLLPHLGSSQINIYTSFHFVSYKNKYSFLRLRRSTKGSNPVSLYK